MSSTRRSPLGLQVVVRCPALPTRIPILCDSPVPHSHDDHGRATDPAFDLDISDRDLDPSSVSRRSLLKSMGLLGAGVAAFSVTQLGTAGRAAAQSAPASTPAPKDYAWLSGDHHVHTQYSADGVYSVKRHLELGQKNRANWAVITDHGAVIHQKVSVGRTFADIQSARRDFPSMTVFQGLEWNIPGAEHGTVFFAPGPLEQLLLEIFEYAFDGAVLDPNNPSSPRLDPYATQALRWMEAQVRVGNAPAALFFANHPARRGLDSPSEIRAWNDAAPSIALGFEGAPGHQAAGFSAAELGPASSRGFYGNTPNANSWPGFPAESYRTYGGFDWMAATVGGMWDSVLAEGRNWWITANSDGHQTYKDNIARIGDGQFAVETSPYYGKFDSVLTAGPTPGLGDFWINEYSRTVVGSAKNDAMGVMSAMRDGRMWVVHGDLIAGLDMRLSSADDGKSGAPLGGRVGIARGQKAYLTIDIDLASKPNAIGNLPVLKRVDVIAGPITGPNPDRDSFVAPETKVIKSFDVTEKSGRVTIKHTFENVTRPFYVRVRGHDGNFTYPGSIEPRLDPTPMNPWTDLWFYSNPIRAELR